MSDFTTIINLLLIVINLGVTTMGIKLYTEFAKERFKK